MTSFLVAQLGARRHYAIPQILQEAGQLERVYTDICSIQSWPRYLSCIPQQFQTKAMRQLAARVPSNVPKEKITSYPRFGIEYYLRLKAAQSRSEAMEVYLWAGKTFCHLVNQEDWGGAESVYVFNSAALEILQQAKKHKIHRILEQTIAPHAIERRLLQEEQALHPTWQVSQMQSRDTEEYIIRECMEWDATDIIMCGSDFVKDSIRECNGPVDRCVVVPTGVDKSFQVASRQRHTGPLRVLTVGEVGLRKGSPYVLEVAKALRGKAIFRMVGSINVSSTIATQLQSYIDLVGIVPRSEIMQHYEWADVFLLPSICEGSAIVTYEALAAGLPVITTPNSGSIVKDDEDGYVVPIRDVEDIVEHLSLLNSTRDLLHHMSELAQKKAQKGNIRSYGERVLTVTQRLNNF